MSASDHEPLETLGLGEPRQLQTERTQTFARYSLVGAFAEGDERQHGPQAFPAVELEPAVLAAQEETAEDRLQDVLGVFLARTIVVFM